MQLAIQYVMLAMALVYKSYDSFQILPIKHTAIDDAAVPKEWFLYLSEKLQQSSSTPMRGISKHLRHIYFSYSSLYYWCDRRFHNIQDSINVLDFVPCGKIIVNRVIQRIPIAHWQVVVNDAFNLMINFTRFEMDSSTNQCQFTNLR